LQIIFTTHDPLTLSDIPNKNIVFLDKNTDVYCHTWNIDWNGRWMIKLNRYKKYCNSLKVVMEKPKFEKNPNKVLENSFQKAISDHIDNDKMVFLDSKSEKFIIINENLGNYKGKNWFSNTYWEIPKPKFNLNLYGNNNYNSFDYDYLTTPTEKEIKKMTYMDIEMFVDHCFTHYDTVPIIELISKYQRKILSRK